MSESINQSARKGGEAELSELIAWLRNEIASAEQQKRDKILQAARRLKELGFRKDWIASTLAEYSNILEVSRSYIYDSLPDEFKSKRRSDAQKGAKLRALSPLSDIQESQSREVAIANDGSSIDNMPESDGIDESATIAWKEAVELRAKTLDKWIPVVNSVIQEAVMEGDYVRVPIAVWERFTRIAEETVK